MINLTPHPIVVRKPDGSETVFPPSGTVARVSMTEEVIGDLGGIPVVRRTPGAVTGLPDGDEAVIVSSMVAAAVPGRPNTFAPDTGATAIRDDAGQVVAVTRLVAA